MRTQKQPCGHCGRPATAGPNPADPGRAWCIECAAVATVTVPAAGERRAPVPESIRSGPAWKAAAPMGPDGTLWLHQALTLEKLEQGRNVVAATSTASGKSLPFQLWTLHGAMSRPDFTGLIFYPTKALANDQARRWQQACAAVGLPPQTMGEINGDVPVREREKVMERSRIIVMTPDVCHAWMLAQAHQGAVRKFLAGLGAVIIDEAHSYEFVFGSNAAYLFRRLIAAAHNAGNRGGARMIAATATILEPEAHLERLTGQPFDLVDESQNGSPRYPRTICHLPLAARPPDRERAVAGLVTSIIDGDPDAQVIAFQDSRQGVERTVQLAGRPREVMPYRSGYLAEDRRAIEDALRDGSIRAVVSTSALELGIDMPDLTHGINLDLPDLKKQFHQRLGRVGRSRPGTFVILAPPERFVEYGSSLAEYHRESVEPSRLYLANEHICYQQALCLKNELQKARRDSLLPPEQCSWGEEFTKALRNAHGSAPAHLENLARRAGLEPPQRVCHLRSAGEEDLELLAGPGRERIGHISMQAAMREAYPGALYRHRGRSYVAARWARNGETGRPFVVLEPARRGKQGTRPVLRRVVAARSGPDELIGHRLRRGRRGTLSGLRISVTESVEGYRSYGPEGTTYYREASRQDPGKSRKQRVFTTTAVHLQIAEPWAAGETGEPWQDRTELARALRRHLAYHRSIARADLAAQVDNIIVDTPRGAYLSDNSIIVYDNVHGGLGLSLDLFDRLHSYAARLNQGDPWERRGASPEAWEMFAQWAREMIQDDGEEPPGPGPDNWWRVVRPGSRVQVYSPLLGRMAEGEAGEPEWDGGVGYRVDVGPEQVPAGDLNLAPSGQGFDWQLWQPRTGRTKELEFVREEGY